MRRKIRTAERPATATINLNSPRSPRSRNVSTSPPARSLGALGAATPPESILKSARELDRRERLLTAREAADLLRLSPSWLAKARMRGDGSPYAKPGF